MWANVHGRNVFPHLRGCKCVNSRNEGSAGLGVDPAGQRVSGHNYTSLSEDTYMSSLVGVREHLGEACGCCRACVAPSTVLGAGDRAVNKTQTQPLGAAILVEEFRAQTVANQ